MLSVLEILPRCVPIYKSQCPHKALLQAVVEPIIEQLFTQSLSPRDVNGDSEKEAAAQNSQTLPRQESYLSLCMLWFVESPIVLSYPVTITIYNTHGLKDYSIFAVNHQNVLPLLFN